MSRANKQLRRKHRKEKKQKHARFERDWIMTGDRELPDDVRLLSYDITFEPLHIAKEKTPGLDKALSDIRDQLAQDIIDNPKAAIPVLQRLLEQFPNAPMLLNWLAASLARVGDIEGYKRITRQNFEANPNYLFARLNYAQIRVEEGDLDAVDEILERKFDLKLLCPQRNLFHISEYRGLCMVMIPYWMKKGEFEAARNMFDTLEELEPDGEATRALSDAIDGSYLLQAARKLANFALRRGRLPR